MVTLAARDLPPLAPVSVAVAVWGLGYALYRAYYTHSVGQSCCRALSPTPFNSG
jgi:hypothetical protein